MGPEWSWTGWLLDHSLAICFIGYLIWAFPRRRRKKPDCVADGPADEPYRIYTRAHDMTLRANAVPAALAASGPDRTRGHALIDALIDQSVWHRKVDAAREICRSVNSDSGQVLRNAFPRHSPEDWVIGILVDQSGSMRGDPIQHAAAAVMWLSGELTALGATIGIFGFSTVGWWGGKPRQDWLWKGQPKRPGRLCALLHVIYENFDDVLADEDWAVMLHPDLLRENVDGEALLWAKSLLDARPERHKLLLVLSDGAPVDDATLTHNGAKYLWRHLEKVVREIEASDVMLATIGINYDVDRPYHRSHSVDNLTEIPAALAGMIAQIVEEKGLSSG